MMLLLVVVTMMMTTTTTTMMSDEEQGKKVDRNDRTEPCLTEGDDEGGVDSLRSLKQRSFMCAFAAWAHPLCPSLLPGFIAIVAVSSCTVETVGYCNIVDHIVAGAIV